MLEAPRPTSSPEFVTAAVFVCSGAVLVLAAAAFICDACSRANPIVRRVSDRRERLVPKCSHAVERTAPA